MPQKISRILPHCTKRLFSINFPIHYLAKLPLLPNCISRNTISGIQKRQKEEPTSHPGEPLYTQNPLISSHFFTLSPNRSKFLWHQLFIAACAAVRFSGLFTPFTPPNLRFDKLRFCQANAILPDTVRLPHL